MTTTASRTAPEADHHADGPHAPSSDPAPPLPSNALSAGIENAPAPTSRERTAVAAFAPLLATTPQWNQAVQGLLWLVIALAALAFLAGIGATVAGNSSSNSRLSQWGRQTLIVAAATAFVAGALGSVANWAIDTSMGKPDQQPAEVRNEKPEQPPSAATCDLNAALHGRC